MRYLDNKNQLLDLLTQGATVITPNNRLSAALLEYFFTYSNQKTVDKPICLPYNTLIINTYQRLKFLTPEQSYPTLLNEAQCRHLWQTIIKSDTHITYSEGLLKAVMQAWEYSQQWQLTPENPAFQYTPQTQTFQRWWRTFNSQLKDLNVITERQLIPYLIDAAHPLFFQPVIWVCFDEFNPQQLTLQHYLNNEGLTQYRYDLKEHSNIPKVLSAKDNKEEYQQLMSWLNLKIDKGEQRIGVVVPNLEQESRSLQRILQRHFNPTVFNISLGQSLSEFPLVAHALSWLNLESTTINHHQTSLLLQSPYIGNAKEEFIARSHYLQDSTLLQEQKCSLKTLITDLNTSAPKLAALLGKITPYPPKASPEEWISLFQERLNSMGFPGDYGLDSESYQCFNRFTAVFDEFRQLSLISATLNIKEAIAAFTHLTDNTIFQAQKKNAPIQISGLLEASGCEFDSLWVMGLSDQCLPQKTRLSAFIPPQLQRELFMPHSVPARELQFAKQTLQRLQRGSAETVFSYSRLQGDTPNLPCALITDFPNFVPLPPIFEPAMQSFLMAREEIYNLPLRSEEHVSGGTALLANQAKCPFKAFAEHRLKAKPSAYTSDGLNNKEKGQIIHKVMELLWQTLQSQEELFNLSPKDLDLLIEKAIHAALSPVKQVQRDSFSNLIEEVEYSRLKRLVLASLEWEKKRPPFTIAAIEQSYSINLAGLDFKVRVDRLDQVADKKWVIDYKSSLPASKPWNEDRPKEPQLLLYALLDEHINTLLLMQLKTGKITCSGLSEEKLDLSGLSSLKKGETWEEYRNHWQQQLTLLANEFQQGHSVPNPVNSIVCQQCDFQNLCRFQINQ
ncbi:PD-(D/E)XK nuclease family protein [Legionella maioricensis]|uniref:PD-(D/E)XK nuclease family protein n=1 Tax=Legionella maioricensis TaxID=2896528 RepID=A0A9X2D1K7_9GAMM|nr:PD-(D/E)XK nuclease family protein [Legionella maioricensis]MCL9684674.1 PD-(D/E)XK nuclease family protein [Legionella maioricensis]MCL9687702.1 PD-(D/E)XK nuclease family protein [Legionella maioricensis]